MKKTSVGLALVLVLGFTAAASGEAQQIRGIAGAGLSIPMGELGDEADGGAKTGGIHALIGAEWVPLGSRFGARVDGGYQQFCTVACEDAEGNLDVKYQIIHGSLSGIAEFSADEAGRIRPYVLAGVGVYNYKLRGDDVPSGLDLSETDFGVNGGLGLNVDFGSVGMFLEGRFHNVLADGDDLQYLPIVIGVRFGG